jgi:hypothetical protein
MTFALKSLIATLLIVVCYTFASCDNTIKLAAPWKDIPVVYAIFDGSQAIQYVRVEKAFLDDEVGAPQIAQIPDSLYYADNEIQVTLRNKRTSKSVLMVRFDGDKEGLPRKSGIFANKPNWLYRASNSDLGGIQKGDELTIEVRRNDANLPLVSAKTVVPDAMVIVSPGINPGEIVSFPSKANAFEWDSDSNAVLFNTTVFVATRRLNAQNVVLSKDTLTWEIAQNVERGIAKGTNKFGTKTEINSITLYELLRNKLDTIKPGEFRLFDRARIFVKGGGKEIREFQISSSASSGISGAEAIPIFTNVQNGYGLVTALNQSAPNQYQFKASTIDSVKVHPFTKHLGFAN